MPTSDGLGPGWYASQTTSDTEVFWDGAAWTQLSRPVFRLITCPSCGKTSKARPSTTSHACPACKTALRQVTDADPLAPSARPADAGESPNAPVFRLITCPSCGKTSKARPSITSHACPACKTALRQVTDADPLAPSARPPAAPPPAASSSPAEVGTIAPMNAPIRTVPALTDADHPQLSAFHQAGHAVAHLQLRYKFVAATNTVQTEPNYRILGRVIATDPPPQMSPLDWVYVLAAGAMAESFARWPHGLPLDGTTDDGFTLDHYIGGINIGGIQFCEAIGPREGYGSDDWQKMRAIIEANPSLGDADPTAADMRPLLEDWTAVENIAHWLIESGTVSYDLARTLFDYQRLPKGPPMPWATQS